MVNTIQDEIGDCLIPLEDEIKNCLKLLMNPKLQRRNENDDRL